MAKREASLARGKRLPRAGKSWIGTRPVLASHIGVSARLLSITETSSRACAKELSVARGMHSKSLMNDHPLTPSRAVRRAAFPLLFISSLVLSATLGVWPASAQSVAEGAAARPQSIDAIRRAATALVRKHLGVGTAHIIVTAGELDGRLRLEHCPQALDASLPPDTAPRSEVTVRVNCPRAGWSVYVPVRVEADLPVLVLQKPVAMGGHIGAGDVAADTRRVAGVFSEFVPDVAALAGHHSRRMLPAGTVLVADMLAADPVVVRGQEVTLIAALGALEVRAPGRVLSDAAAASRVQVQNLSSLKIVEGTVESADTVRVAP